MENEADVVWSEVVLPSSLKARPLAWEGMLKSGSLLAYTTVGAKVHPLGLCTCVGVSTGVHVCIGGGGKSLEDPEGTSWALRGCL